MTQTLKAILESGGLTEHFEKFDGRGITDSILDEITDSDLRDFGISKLGERKRLLSAFRRSDEFQGAAIASHEDEEDIPAAEVPEPEPPDDVQEIDEAPEETPAPARTTKPRASQPQRRSSRPYRSRLPSGRNPLGTKNPRRRHRHRWKKNPHPRNQPKCRKPSRHPNPWLRP
jgi:hypothetical protein